MKIDFLKNAAITTAIVLATIYALRKASAPTANIVNKAISG